MIIRFLIAILLNLFKAWKPYLNFSEPKELLLQPIQKVHGLQICSIRGSPFRGRLQNKILYKMIKSLSYLGGFLFLTWSVCNFSELIRYKDVTKKQKT